MEGKMKKYNISITGTSPVIWNVMKRELELEKKKLKKNEYADWEEDAKNWKRKAEFDKLGNPIIPNRWFKSCMVASCKKNRIVPSFETKKNATYTNYVQSFMVFNIGKPVCLYKDLEEHGEFVGAQGKNSDSKVWRVRPIKEKWKADFQVIDPVGRMTMGELKEIIEFAGLLIGIGDNRLNNYGRFELTKLVEEIEK
jgi:hypothetical protein